MPFLGSLASGGFGKVSGGPSTSTILIFDQVIFTGLRNALATNLNSFKNASFYEYNLDGTAVTINDGGGDMYDGGNTTALFVNGSQVVSGISYDASVSTVTSNVRWQPLGWARPLSLIATSQSDIVTRYGFGRSGNNGADGGGTADQLIIYTNATVNGFTINAWMKRVYNAGDPSINNLYATIGHPRFDSSFSSTDVTTWSTNTDNDQSQYETTTKNSIVFTTLLSKNSGVAVTQAEAQTVLTSVVSTIASYFNL
jgi:hypothetical protein